MPEQALIKATFFTQSPYLGDRLFDCSDTTLNRDDCLRPFRMLKDLLLAQRVDLSTQDINPPDRAEFVLYSDMPAPRELAGKKRYLLINESELIRPDNWDVRRHRDFDKIFTWHDGFVDGRRYFKINYTCGLELPPEASTRDKLCAMIAGNKRARSPLELYSRRVEAIRWFERHRPRDFDLYGIGWDSPLTLKRAAKALLALDPGAVLERPYPSYRGRVVSKREVLTRCKFSICFENAQGIPGYITEKILNCLEAGCIPVYWGAPNVADHIPERAFIDFRKFSGYDDLFRFMAEMPEADYAEYQDAIRQFLRGEKALPFGHRFFAEQIAKNVLPNHV